MNRTTIWLSVLCVVALSSPAVAAKIGKLAPDFTLQSSDTTGVTLSGFRGKFVVLEWLNHGCPFVKKHYNSGNMQRLQKLVRSKGGIWLSIVSSAPGKQGYHTPAEANALSRKKGAAPTALLLDPTGKVGKLYGAKTTPQMVLITPRGVMVYGGAIDSIRSTDIDDIKKAIPYLLNAWKEALAGKPVSTPLSVPYGCSVKYAN